MRRSSPRLSLFFYGVPIRSILLLLLLLPNQAVSFFLPLEARLRGAVLSVKESIADLRAAPVLLLTAGMAA